MSGEERPTPPLRPRIRMVGHYADGRCVADPKAHTGVEKGPYPFDYGSRATTRRWTSCMQWCLRRSGVRREPNEGGPGHEC